VLQEQEIERLGSTRPVRVDIRVIAATHRNLEEAIRQGRFREDLFYRLNVIPIAVPPLRKRASDIPILVAHFLETYNRSKGKGVEGFAPESLAILARYPWPGNVRELEHLVERVVVLKGEGIVEPRDLPEPYAGDLSHVAMPRHSLPEVGIDLPAWLREMERSLIVQALERTRGVRSRACQLLGIHRTTLVEKMRKLGLLESEFGQGA
jgi:transcriptional regulator with PAS, ATPase and Fis domain